jgi:hypothetical protein
MWSVSAANDRHLAVLGHDPVEAGIVAVARPLAGFEEAQRLVLHLAQKRDVLGEDRDTAEGRALHEAGGVFFRQVVPGRRRVVAEDAARHHDGHPFADVALREAGLVRDLRARRGRAARERSESSRRWRRG